jgi:hypothetical protein
MGMRGRAAASAALIPGQPPFTHEWKLNFSADFTTRRGGHKLHKQRPSSTDNGGVGLLLCTGFQWRTG